MTCTVLDIVGDGVKMRLDYQGTCSGMWFPGVATMLGVDIVLDAQGCEVEWPHDSDGLWTTDGDSALTGSSLDAQREVLKRQDQNPFEAPQFSINETQDMSGFMNGETLPAGRVPSANSASLLRVPLPSRRISSDYSFENSVTPSTSGLPSSVPTMSTSLTRSSVNGSGDISDRGLLRPTSLFTLHLHLNEVLSSPRNTFTFNISGTIIVYRKEAEEDSQSLSVSLPFPMFRVYQAEKQSISQTVRSQCDQASVELDSVTASFTSSRGTRTIVPYGSQLRCPYEDSVIIVRPLPQQPVVKSEELTSPMVFSRASSMAPPTRSSSPVKTSIQLEPQQSIAFDGPSNLPWAKIEVVPLIFPKIEWAYAITLTLPASGALSSDGLEFGLPQPSAESIASSAALGVDVLSASINGTPVNFEKFPNEKADLTMSIDGLSKPSTARWLNWIKVHTGLVGCLELVYIVKSRSKPMRPYQANEKKWRRDVPILLPSFSLPVGRLSIEMHRSSGTYACTSRRKVISDKCAQM